MRNGDRHTRRLNAPLNRFQLQQRLRALFIVGSLLLPTFCVFGVLSFLAVGWTRWLILSIWVILGALLGGLIVRLLNTLTALNQEREE